MATMTSTNGITYLAPTQFAIDNHQSTLVTIVTIKTVQTCLATALSDRHCVPRVL